MKTSINGIKGNNSKLNEDSRKYGSSREAMSNKYAAIREQNRHTSGTKQPEEQRIAAAKVSLLDTANAQSSGSSTGPSSGLAAKWASMKNGFQNFKANMEAKKFIPLRQTQGPDHPVSHASSSESLDEIFQRLNRPSDDDHREDED